MTRINKPISHKAHYFVFIFVIVVLVAQSITTSVSINKSAASFQSGDIIFQSSQSTQCKAVQLATHSKYSHCGIIFIDKGFTFVYEAVQPVKYTPFKEWIKHGKDSKYVVKRLKNASTALTPAVLTKMKTVRDKYIGKNYDLYFDWSDDKIYCSEYVWKIYKQAVNLEVGKLQKLKDFDLSSGPVKDKLKERYGNHIPLDEIVVSPQDIFESELLETVYDGY